MTTERSPSGGSASGPVADISGSPRRTLPDKWLAQDGSPAPNSPEPPVTARYFLSEQYAHLVASPTEFGPVLQDKLARLQNTLPQLGHEHLRQARADIVYIRAVLDGEELGVAQALAGGVYSAAT